MLKLTMKQSGFTVVELVVVIIGIGILTAITVVGYGTFQARASDTKVKDGAGQLEQALKLWSSQTASQPFSGYGSASAATTTGCPGMSNAGGWVASGAYTCTLEDLLRTRGLIPTNFMTDMPANKFYSTGTLTWANYMFYSCGSQKYALLWSLRSPTAEETANFDSIRTTCGFGTDLRDTYGMRAAKIIEF